MKKENLGPPYFSGHEVGGPSTQYFVQLKPFIQKPVHSAFVFLPIQWMCPTSKLVPERRLWCLPPLAKTLWK